MRSIETRLLRGPNRFATAPCCVATIALDGDDSVFIERSREIVAALRRAIGDLQDVDLERDAAIGSLVGEVAVALQRAAGCDSRLIAVARRGDDRLQVACGYVDEAIAGPALEAGVALVTAALHDESIEVSHIVAGLRATVDAHAVDDRTAALLDAARARDIPVLCLDADARRYQLGWGCRQHRLGGRPAGTDDPAVPGVDALDAWFPGGTDGRIPTVAVTGTNGKTTTTLLIGHVLATTGARPGITTTSGVLVDGRYVERGDCTGYWSARTVLSSPAVDVAVLETARGGILKRGLAFDRCDVGVVLNVAGDHLGLDGVQTLADLAHVKGLVARSAARAAVLNADDAHCVAMRDTLRPGCECVWFSMDAAHPLAGAHVAAGGRAAVLDRGVVSWWAGAERHALVDAAALPFTLGGHARHNVANALAAFAAAICLGQDPTRVAAAARTFESDARQNPLRGNRFDIDGRMLIVDYAHNAVAYRALCDTARALLGGAGRLIGVVTSPGDRREDDLRDVGRVCGEAFDELFVYEQDPRGRPAGQTVEAILAGSRDAAATKPSHGVPAIRDALSGGLARSTPGDIVVFTCAGTLDDLVEGVRRVHPASADRIAAAVAGAG